jgi:nucleoid-associated protein YgaU
MGFVEKYGLAALFVLCGLILMVGIFADDGALQTRRETDQRERHVSERGDTLLASNPNERSELESGVAVESGENEATRDYRRAFEDAQGQRDLANGGMGGGLQDDVSSGGNSGPVTERVTPRRLDDAFVAPEESAGLADDRPVAIDSDAEPTRGDIQIGGRPREVPAAPSNSEDEAGPSGSEPGADQAVEYRVRKGDGLWVIAGRFYGSKARTTAMNAIRAANPKKIKGELVPYPATILLPTEGMLAEKRAALTGTASASRAKNASAKKSESKPASDKKTASKKSGKTYTRVLGKSEHVVREGESLWTICSRFYKRGALYKALAAHNKLDHSKGLPAGTKLSMPKSLALE